jgi:hypothetical protein
MVYLLRKNIKIKRPSDKLNHTKLGPFKIIKKLGLVTYRLEIPEGICKGETSGITNVWWRSGWCRSLLF